MTEEEFKKMWAGWLVDIGKTTSDVALSVGDKPANLQKKIRNHSIRYMDIANIVEEFGYTVSIRKKE